MVRFRRVPREQNCLADALAAEAATTGRVVRMPSAQNSLVEQVVSALRS
jgi:hypothetical protein